jgi:hypothetical protein
MPLRPRVLGSLLHGSTAPLLLASTFVLMASCSSEKPVPQPISIPESEATPRVITDLSSLGPANPAAAQIKLPPASLEHRSESLSPAAANGTAANLKRLFGETPGQIGYSGVASAPGKELLANAKAQQFPIFTRTLLHQVFVAAQVEERDVSFSRERLPREIKPVVVSATMNKNGRLTQLILEQSSSTGAVDQLMVRACKTGLWTNNPPPAALSSTGDYRIRIEALINNYNNQTAEEVWSFSTELSLALE